MRRETLVGFYDEITSIHDLEKTAIDPVTMLLGGAASHIGTNLVARKLHHSPLLTSARSKGLGRGIREAIEGKPRGFKSRATELLAGPDFTASEDIGRLLGSGLRNKSRGQQHRALKKLRKATAMAPEDVRSLPFFEDLVPGINRALEAPLPRTGRIEQLSRAQRAAPYLAAAPAAILEPGAAVHMGVNKLRSLAANSPLGKKFAKNSLIAGARESTLADRVMGALPGEAKTDVVRAGLSPKKRSRMSDLATEVFLSPASQAPKTISRGVADSLSNPANVRPITRFVSALHNVAGPKPGNVASQALSSISEASKGLTGTVRDLSNRASGVIGAKTRPTPTLMGRQPRPIPG
jgi:hypothetical protein